jgi:PAS domain S-box-containing protein
VPSASATTRTVEELTAIIDSVPTAVIMVDARGTIVLVNAQAERLFGYMRAELMGELVDILVPSRLREAHPTLRQSFATEPRARPMGAGRDLFGTRKDGSEFPIEIGLSPIVTPEGRYVVSAIVDISERKRLEERFRATVESAPTAILMMDRFGTIVLVNAELERLFGYARDELIRQKVEVLLPERFRATHPALRGGYLAKPESRRMGAGRELFGLRKDGTEFPVEIGLNPVSMDEGMFVLSAILDISEREQTKKLVLAVDALARSNIELQRFAYVASHDLQTPMRSIASFVQLIGSTYADKLDQQGQDWILRTTVAIKYLQAMVRDLLTYSRIDSQAIRFEPIPMRDVLDAATLLLDAAIREAGAEVIIGNMPIVMGDRSQLVQLLHNLVGNGIKYRGARTPKISVSADRVDINWVFVVRDNGIGVDSRHYERIFEVFQRLHDQSEYPGTGIGLALCRRVVNAHGGKIWLESQVGLGSNFYFSIPADKGDAT